MQYTRQEVVDMLRKAGLREIADKAAAELPDPVEQADVEAWGTRYGVSRDMLISELGGSP